MSLLNNFATGTHASDQEISSSPQSFCGTPQAFQTALEESTMLLGHGSKSWSESQPIVESHSSTTMALTLLPLA